MDRTVRVRLEAAVEGYQAAMGRAQASTREFGREVGHTSKVSKADLTTVGTAFTLMGGAAGAAFAFAGRASMDFDRQMSAVGAVANSTATDMDKLRAAALKAGADTAFSASEAAAAEEELVKAGIAVSDVLGGALMGSLDLAAAGQLQLADAATISAQAMNIFKLEGSDVGHIADVLASGANKSAADVGQLGDALRQGGLVAAQTGLSLEETAAALALMADNSLVGSDAGTSLKTMLQRLTPQSAEARKLMEELGFSAYDASGNFIGLAGLADELQTALGDMTVQQRNAALATLFGSDAVRGANVLYTSGADVVRDYIDAVDDQGAAAEMAADRLDNLAGDVEALSGSIETALITSGSSANGMLREMVQTATGAVNLYNAAPPRVQAFATALTGIAGAAGLVGGGLLLVVPRLVDTHRAVKDLAQQSPRAAAGLSRVGRALGWATAAYAAAEAGRMLGDSLRDLTGLNVAGAEDMAVAIRDLALGAELSGDAAAQVDALGGALQRVTNPTGGDRAKDIFAGIATLGTIDTGSLDEARARLEALDQALVSLVGEGNADVAADQLRALIGQWKAAGMDVSGVEGALDDYTRSLTETDQKQQLTGESAEQVGEAAEEMGEGLDVGTQAADRAADAMDRFAETLEATVGVFLDVASADIAYEQAIDDVTASLEENGLVLDRTTEAGRANESAIIDAVRAATAIAGHVDQLRDELEQAGLTKGQVDRLLESYGAMPDQIMTAIGLAGFDPTMRQLEALAQAADRIGRDVHIAVSGTTVGGRTQHAGGWAGTGPEHAGHLLPNEVAAVLERGEFVVRQPAAARYGPMLQAINSDSLRLHGGGWAGTLDPGGRPPCPDPRGLLDQLAEVLS